jgi:tRNA(Ile)-lysidine synthase
MRSGSFPAILDLLPSQLLPLAAKSMAKRSSLKQKVRRTHVSPAEHLSAQVLRGASWRAGERVAVAVSGGADSVALLCLLLEIQKQLGIVLSVVHLNHQLRGRASDADERFVAAVAAKHGLDFHLERVDVAAKAKREKANLEDAARRARYDFFSRLVTDQRADRVAVAHTADDQAETVLAHILRGTGLAGLGGIHPETEQVVRPLLHVRRAQLRSYLRSKKQRWREDATNRDASRLRARLRRKLLPLLEKEFQPATVEHLVSLAELAREDELLLDWLARTRCESLATKSGETTQISVADLLAPLAEAALASGNPGGTGHKSAARATLALTKRMFRRLMDESKSKESGRSAQITAQHIAAALTLAEPGQSGKTLQLPGVELRRERDILLFSPPAPRSARSAVRAPEKNEAAYEHQIDFQRGSAALRFATPRCALRFTVIDWPANRVETRELGTVLDRDRLRFPLVLRNWRPGDKLQPTGHQKAHKLKRLFNEKRISRWERQGWPVLASGRMLVWVRGFPAAAGFGAGEKTRKAILIAEEP